MRLLFKIAAMLSIALFSAVGSVQAASITVSETADDFGGSVCTLRNAIESVNTTGDFGGCDFDETEPFGTNDTINLSATSPYVLDRDGGGENLNANGDLDILASVQIIGLGSSQTTVTAAFATGEEDRIFDINDGSNEGDGGFIPGLTVLFQGMTITGGNTIAINEDGGGLRVETPQTQANLNDVIVSANRTSEDGGGIRNSFDCFLNISNSQINGNFADPDGEGGAITNEGFLQIVNSTLDGNSAQDGGAIENEGGAFLAIANSTISDNTAAGPVNGGAGEPTTGSGGGIWNSGFFLIVNSTISGNQSADFGGGIFSFLPESPEGVDPQQSFAMLFNVTIAENEVLNANGIGGGICFDCEPEVMTTGVPVNFFVTNTLIASNTATTGPDCAGTFTSDGYNLIGDATNCDGFTATGDQLNVADPLIGGLASNGGSTQTHALLAGSPAIDRGNDVDGCQAPDPQALLLNGTFNFAELTTDQRGPGFVRPIAILDPNVPICDIGAFEFQAFDFDVTKVDGLNGQPVNVGDNFTYTITVTNTGPGDATNVTLSDPLPATLTFVSVTASQGTCSQAAGTVSCDLGALAQGDTATVSITVTTTAAGTLTNVVTVTSVGTDQTTVTKTAEATSTVIAGTNLLLFGSGLGCSLNAAAASPAGISLIGVGLAFLLGWLRFRSRN